MNHKLIVALDVSNLEAAEKLVERLHLRVKIFKVGKELFTACGPKAVEMIEDYGAQVFLDLKFHDIPNTVASACVMAVRHKVFMLNVHASGGKRMLTEAAASVKKAAIETNRVAPYLLAVTVLTSMGSSDLKEVGIEKTARMQVRKLAKLTKECGLDGVVASGQEIEMIRKTCGDDFLIVTPGVRPLWAVSQDQKRIVTPREAIKKGADFIVVGRPITGHKDPLEAAERILTEIG